jgi:hypothetical protein
MTYNASRGRVVIFGGGVHMPVSNTADWEHRWLRDMWEWDGTRWTALAMNGPPSNGAQPGFAYDARRDRLVLFGGGGLPGTWEWDGVRWSRVR